MREAVIVSTARTPIGRAFKGSLNNTKSPTMTAHAIRHAVERAGIEGREIEDVIIGSVLNMGTVGMNVVVAGGQDNISAVQAPYFESVAQAADEFEVA